MPLGRKTTTYLPAALGVMMQLAGVCYLINSFALLLAPDLANALFPGQGYKFGA